MVQRRVRGLGQQEVMQPKLVSSYNKGMSGVDLYDRLCGAYRPNIRGKKWYLPLVLYAINKSVVAAWRLHCAMDETNMSHLDFRREVTLCFIKVSQQPRRERSTIGLPVSVRQDGVGHEKVVTTEGRCRVCQKNTKKMCIKCGVRLWKISLTCISELSYTQSTVVIFQTSCDIFKEILSQ